MSLMETSLLLFVYCKTWLRTVSIVLKKSSVVFDTPAKLNAHEPVDDAIDTVGDLRWLAIVDGFATACVVCLL